MPPPCQAVRIAAILTASALFSTAAAAQTAATPATTVPATAAAAAAPATAAPFTAAVMLSDDTLGTIAGREDTSQAALADQQATVTRNSVGNNVRTGDAKISDNAFQNMSGLSILNVNTGNNVAINAAMNVTIALQPGQ